ncbi:MAG: serine/threonine-protein phosphatase, partial [Selenomonadaceae bacterium]|nr:serine/threonine-protein phosphatase [Selenomonadaceae bacterium]
VTVFLGVLDLLTGHFVYADAGHCPPLLGHGGSYGFLPMEKCCMLWLLEQPYEQQGIDLAPGDTLFLYTDGVSEAMDEQRNQFTEQRIRDTLDALPPEEAIEDILPEVLERIRQHAGDAEQSDDITMLGLRYYGSRC